MTDAQVNENVPAIQVERLHKYFGDNEVLKGITQLQIGLGFESGIAIVILAIFLDRVTQAVGDRRVARGKGKQGA